MKNKLLTGIFKIKDDFQSVMHSLSTLMFII